MLLEAVAIESDAKGFVEGAFRCCFVEALLPAGVGVVA